MRITCSLNHCYACQGAGNIVIGHETRSTHLWYGTETKYFHMRQLRQVGQAVLCMPITNNMYREQILSTHWH